MRTYEQRKRHNEVATGLSFVAVALMVLGFMGIAQHFGLSLVSLPSDISDVRSHPPRTPVAADGSSPPWSGNQTWMVPSVRALNH